MQDSIGDRVTLRDQRHVFVAHCEKGGRGGLRPPKVSVIAVLIANTGLKAKHRHWSEIVKIYDAECEWGLERIIRKTYVARE
jgi:hypothetical protein